MKKIEFVMLAILSIAIFSCNDDDGYSLNDQWIGFGMLKNDSGTILIKMDNGDVLKPVAWDYNLNGGDDFGDGSRVLVNFTILDEELNEDGSVNQYLVKINEAREILMKGILTLTNENADSIGNDPLVVKEYWMTDSLLNLKIKYWGYNKVHFINLVQDSTTLLTDEPIQLELRHNANEDDESLPYSAFVSFSLNQLRVAGKDSITVEINSTDYDGESHSFQQVFNFSDLPLPGQGL